MKVEKGTLKIETQNRHVRRVRKHKEKKRHEERARWLKKKWFPLNEKEPQDTLK